MNNTPSFNELNKTAKMDPNLLTRHYKLKLINDFLHIKYQNPQMKQSEIADHLSKSSSFLQRYRNDMNMLSPYRISPNNVKKRPKKTKFDDIADLKRLQMTSDCFKTDSKELIKKKKNLKGGSLQEDVEITEHYLDKILKKTIMFFIFELV